MSIDSVSHTLGGRLIPVIEFFSDIFKEESMLAQVIINSEFNTDFDSFSLTTFPNKSPKGKQSEDPCLEFQDDFIASNSHFL